MSGRAMIIIGQLNSNLSNNFFHLAHFSTNSVDKVVILLTLCG